VSILEAGQFDADTAYAAINTLRLDELRPHILRTTTAARPGRRSSAAFPDGGIVNVVREDPVRRGLLFCGTSRRSTSVFDDGESWQPSA